MVQTHRPDVVLMDLEMPRMNGIEATQQIFEVCPAPVVILTAYDTPELLQRASHAGVGAYLLKPPDADELQRAIAIAIARFADMIELQRLNAELQAQNQELDAFAHTVAHDLKNPLSTVIGFADAINLYYDTLSDDERKNQLRIIMQSAEKMNSIINELLLLASVRQMETITTQPLDMNHIIRQVKERLTVIIKNYQATLIVPNIWPVAYGYQPWIEEVWANYISNAIKYGGEPPHITLGANPAANGMIHFWVKDNGDGLTPEEQDRLFQPFVRLGNIQVTGHGLGLSIVKRIIERHGGQIWVESQKNKGSTFHFSLPAAATDHQGAV
jgi:signal transduction histidine kinase